MFGCMPPRDVLLTVGNEILEAPCLFAAAGLNTCATGLCWNSIIKKIPNFRWETAPKPRLSDRRPIKKTSGKNGILSEEEQWRITENSDWIITETEPLFDAADVARFGKDLFVQKSMVTNDAGIEWLRRHYPDHRVHRVTYREMLPWHIDATLIPLSPGLAAGESRALPP